jgi:hypothetical protein
LAERPIRSRGRFLALVALVAAVAASGFLLDPKAPRSGVVGAIEDTETGAWFCPHGGVGGARGWVVLANPGRTDVSVRVTTFGKNGVRGLSTFALPAGHQAYREVPATESGASTEVEFFGGWIGAASVIQGGKSKPGLAGERCVSTPRRMWFLPDQATGRGETGFAVVMNPFSTPAQFNVVIRTERRTISPTSLTPFVLAPRSSVGIKLNDFALEAPGEKTITTRIVQQIGRVVAGSLAVTGTSLREEAGVSALGRRWTIPGADRTRSGDVTVMNPGPVRADVTVIRQGRSVQEVLSGADGLAVSPGAVLAYGIDHMKGAGLQVEATNKARLAAEAVLAGPGDDTATVAGTSDPASTWLVLPLVPPEGGESVLVLQNPGRSPVDVAIRLIGGNGTVQPPEIGSRTVPAGRTVVIPLETGTGIPVSALVRAKDGTFVAAGASYVGDGEGYAATPGLPISG